MTPEIKSMALLAAKVGHRTPAGHRAHTVGSLLGVEPEHPNHARRHLDLLAEQTEGLARALSDLSSQHGQAGHTDQAQQPGDRA